MGSIFKKFGQGILYILVLPFFLIAVTLFGVYGVFLFLVLMVKSIILFFQGKSVHGDLPEDIEARRRLHPEPVEPNKNVILEERDPIIVVDRKEEIPEKMEAPRIEDESVAPAIEDRPEIKAIEEEPIEEYKEEEDLADFIEDEPEYKAEPEIDDEELEEEDELEDEEDIPFFDDNSSNIQEDSDEDDDRGGVHISDWRDK